MRPTGPRPKPSDEKRDRQVGLFLNRREDEALRQIVIHRGGIPKTEAIRLLILEAAEKLKKD
jgi:hypothetical protein